MGCGLDGQDLSPWRGQEICLYSTASRPALGLVQVDTEGSTPGVKQQVHEADHSPPSNAKVRNGCVTPPFPHTLIDVVINQGQGQFYL
jgi:hypothetical protein